MYGWIRGWFSRKTLVVLSIVILGSVGLTEHFTVITKHPTYSQQITAALLMFEAIAAIRELREELGLPINKQLDPNETGLIGDEFTELTTSLGSLEAKRTSTNPAFAAAMVRHFYEAGLKQGDLVAIGASGSFPALIIATLAAAKVLELKPLVVYSVGASMYGANLPGFTFVEMLDYLNTKGIFEYQLLAISPGGDLDQAQGLLSPLSTQKVARLGADYGTRVIISDSLAESIQTRLRIYEQAAQKESIRCFVNIGGASANFGETAASLDFKSGLSLKPTVRASGPERGLIFEFAERGVPVINLLNIRGLALESGLPIDPYPLPPVGSGGVYYQVSYRKELPIIAIAVMLLISSKKWREKWK